MITTTLNEIRKHRPCTSGWYKLLNYLGKTKADDEPLTLITVLDNNGFDNALWCLRVLPDEYLKDVQQLALSFAKDVKYLMTDQRNINALSITVRYLDCNATKHDLRDIIEYAVCADWTARADEYAACAAEYASCAAKYAVHAVHNVHVVRAAEHAADAAEYASCAAEYASCAAAHADAAADADAVDIAFSAARQKQEYRLREFLLSEI